MFRSSDESKIFRKSKRDFHVNLPLSPAVNISIDMIISSALSSKGISAARNVCSNDGLLIPSYYEDSTQRQVDSNRLIRLNMKQNSRNISDEVS
jgi:hypothetical protein